MSFISSGSLKIVFEDPYLVVVDKPGRVFTQPQVIEPESEKKSLAEILSLDFPEIKKVGGSDWGACHRLDYETSGLVVFARNQQVYEKMRVLFGKGLVEKEYRACVHGVVKESGRIDVPLGPDPKSKKKVKAYRNRKEAIRHEAVEALTFYEPTDQKTWQDTTWLKVKIVTGFRHQIRAHLKYLGHPIVGDPVYGDHDKDMMLAPKRMYLEAVRLAFVHPMSKEKLNFVQNNQK